MIGVILVLVVLMSGFCYYRGGSVRFQGSTVPGFEGSELWNLGTVEPWNFGTLEPWNVRC